MIISAIIKALEGKLSALLLMRSKLLVSQTYKALQGVGISELGQLTGDKEDVRDVTVATIQSLHKMSDKQLGSVGALIVDEVHEFSSTKIEKQLMKLKSTSFRLGFSATPWKDDDMIHNYRLKSNFGSELSDIGVLELQERGILSECVINFHEVQLKGIKDRNYQDAENEGIVQNFEFHMKVSQLIRQIPSGRIMIMVSKLQHGDYLHSLLPGSFWIRGSDDMESREVVLEMLRSTKEKKVVVIMSKIGYIGINVHLHHLINATGGKSSLQLIQKLGRGLRTSEDKEYLSYHDFDFKGNKYLEEHSKHRKSILINQGYSIRT
uniref:Helicase ATP-binding domain-containing protein n=1 Tax=Arcella intermedia TaxID=1963864 RepID=A0A6B2L776_9EUKA